MHLILGFIAAVVVIFAAIGLLVLIGSIIVGVVG